MRRGLGRGRVLVGVGSVIALVAMALPWWTVGTAYLTPRQQNGFDGAGMLVFVAGIGLLALLILPYASRTGTSSLDRPMSYVVLAAAGVVGLVIELVQLFGIGQLGFPDRAPGLWLAAVGLFVICWGVGELLSERPTTV
jgi:quinol-cytochrome oxidoreductase complex cytochrome b subunit